MSKTTTIYVPISAGHIIPPPPDGAPRVSMWCPERVMKLVTDSHGLVRLNSPKQDTHVYLTWGRFWIVDNGIPFQRPDRHSTIPPLEEHVYYRWIDGVLIQVWPSPTKAVPSDDIWVEPSPAPDRQEAKNRFEVIDSVVQAGISVNLSLLQTGKYLAGLLGLGAVERYDALIQRELHAQGNAVQKLHTSSTYGKPVKINTYVFGYSDQAITAMIIHMLAIDAVIDCKCVLEGRYLQTTWKSQEAMGLWVADRMLAANAYPCVVCLNTIIETPDALCFTCEQHKREIEERENKQEYIVASLKLAVSGDGLYFEYGGDVEHGTFIRSTPFFTGAIIDYKGMHIAVNALAIRSVESLEIETGFYRKTDNHLLEPLPESYT